MNTELNIVARRIFNRLDVDIGDRRGLGNEWDQISPNVKNVEIRSAWEQSKITGETSDGYHTFSELYEHRHALFLALLSIKVTGKWMSKKHNDGSEMGGWFIAGIRLSHGDISYHLPMRLWDSCVKIGAEVLPNAPKWDGHISKDVIDRLMKYATS